MTRTVTGAMLTAAGSRSSRPAYLVEIVWSSFASHLCTYGTVAWNGVTWSGSGVDVLDFNDEGIPGRIVLADPDAAFRTLLFSDGLRDRTVRVWKCDIAALAVADPVPVFAGYADGCDAGGGRVTFGLDLSTCDREFCPRERIGPSIGVNYVAPPGTRIVWGGSVLVLESR